MSRKAKGKGSNSLSESLLRPNLQPTPTVGNARGSSALAPRSDKLPNVKTKVKQGNIRIVTTFAPDDVTSIPFVTDDVDDSEDEDVASASTLMLSELREAFSKWDEGHLSDGSARWVVTRMIGKGGSGAVFKAHDVRGKKDVAVKMVKPCSTTFSKKQVRQLRREAEAMKQIEDENVCGCHDYTFVAQDGQCSKLADQMSGRCTLFVMILEYLDGKTVRQLMTESPTGRLSEPQTVGVALAILSGLRRVHEMGLSHKDLKPDNIMRIFVDGNPSYKIVDFGLVSADSSSAATNTFATIAVITVAGTPHYMSPEQIRDSTDEPVGALSDLWSVGVCMYEMLSGRVPFGALETSALVITGEVRARTLVDLNDLQGVVEGMPRVSDGVAEQVAKALEKDSRYRCQSATLMREALLAALVDSGDTKYDCFLNYRVWSEGSDVPGNGYCPRIFDLLSSTEITVANGARSKRPVVYLDKVRLIDGQCFDKGFMNGLGNSAVFVPLLSRRALERMLDLRPGNDFVDFVLVEYIVALALLHYSEKKRLCGSVRAVFPLCIGDENADGTQTDEFFNELLSGRVRTLEQLRDEVDAKAGTPIPDFVSAATCDKADELLHQIKNAKGKPLTLPGALRTSVLAVVRRITSFQMARLHMDAQLSSVATAAAAQAGVQPQVMDSLKAQEANRHAIAKDCAKRIADVIQPLHVAHHENEITRRRVRPNRHSVVGGLAVTETGQSHDALAAYRCLRDWPVHATYDLESGAVGKISKNTVVEVLEVKIQLHPLKNSRIRRLRYNDEEGLECWVSVKDFQAGGGKKVVMEKVVSHAERAVKKATRWFSALAIVSVMLALTLLVAVKLAPEASKRLELHAIAKGLEPDPCGTDTCSNGGTCRSVCGKVYSIYTGVPSFKCSCATAWGGTSCTVRLVVTNCPWLDVTHGTGSGVCGSTARDGRRRTARDGDHCKVSCDEGYRSMLSSSTLTCKTSGVWSDPKVASGAPLCVAKLTTMPSTSPTMSPTTPTMSPTISPTPTFYCCACATVWGGEAASCAATCYDWSAFAMDTCGGTRTTATGLTSALSASSTAMLRVLLSSNASSGTAYGTGADSDTTATNMVSAAQRVAIIGAAHSGSGASGAGGLYSWPGRFTTSGSLVLLRLLFFKQNNGNYSSDLSGGAVCIRGGNASIVSSSFTSNSAGNGGAVFIGRGTVSIVLSTFTSNLSGGGGAVIVALGKVSIVSSSFISNSAVGGGGAVVISGGTVSIVLSSFTSNPSSGGGALYTTGGTVSIVSSTFTFNSATGDGGAVYIAGFVGSTASIVSSTFTSNSATLGGGAVFIAGGGNASIVSSSFTSNSAIQPLSNAAGEGSAIYVHNAKLQLRDSVLRANICKGSLGGYPSALFVNVCSPSKIDDVCVPWSVVTLGNVTFVGNVPSGHAIGCDVPGNSTKRNRHYVGDAHFASHVVDSGHC